MPVLTSYTFPTQEQFFRAEDVLPDALVLQTSTPTVELNGDADSAVVPFLEFDGSGFVPEGNDIPQDTPVSRTVTIFSGKIADLAKVSNESYQSQGMSELIANAINRGMTIRANAAYLAQVAPTSPATTPPAGILNQSPTAGGTISANLDAVADALAEVEEHYGAVTHVLADPTSWAKLTKLKTGTGSNLSLLGAGSSAAGRELLGVPVLTSPSMPANTLLALDSRSILRAAGPLRVAISSEAFFGADCVAVRATWRFGAKIADPTRVVELTLGS